MRYDKPSVLVVKAEYLFALADTLFTLDKKLSIVVTGNSMYPLMRHKADQVTLSKTSFEDIRVNDIVLARNKQGKFILHRVVKKKPTGFYMTGDAQTELDGPYAPEQLIAVVTEILRLNKRGQLIQINLHGVSYGILTRLWRLLTPLRPFLIATYRRVRKRTTWL